MSGSSAAKSTLNLKRAFLGVMFRFVFLAILIVVLGATSFQLSKTGTARSAELSERLLPGLESLSGLQEATLKYNLSNLEFVTGRDEETQARRLAAAAGYRKRPAASIRPMRGSFRQKWPRRSRATMKPSVACKNLSRRTNLTKR